VPFLGDSAAMVFASTLSGGPSSLPDRYHTFGNIKEISKVIVTTGMNELVP